MQAICKWQEGLAFTAELGAHTVRMDARAPLGRDSAPSPKQLLLAAIAGCTAMDVVSHLRKTRQNLKSLTVDTQAETTKGHPSVFEEVVLLFQIAGEVEASAAIESVELSQSKFCGVSAMISKVSPLRFVIELNGKEIHRGRANFNF